MAGQVTKEIAISPGMWEAVQECAQVLRDEGQEITDEQVAVVLLEQGLDLVFGGDWAEVVEKAKAVGQSAVGEVTA